MSQQKVVAAKYNLVHMHTPVLAVTFSECSASMVSSSIVIEDEVASLPLVMIYDTAVIEQSS